ncbi:MAG: hypothetical protein WCY21_07190 [Candidatus Cloacimonadaceae bacterium]|jgi:hypothetical protein|nr:hypothetical protein [Candidatus Syntrophosphaera sp.]
MAQLVIVIAQGMLQETITQAGWWDHNLGPQFNIATVQEVYQAAIEQEVWWVVLVNIAHVIIVIGMCKNPDKHIVPAAKDGFQMK